MHKYTPGVYLCVECIALLHVQNGFIVTTECLQWFMKKFCKRWLHNCQTHLEWLAGEVLSYVFVTWQMLHAIAQTLLF